MRCRRDGLDVTRDLHPLAILVPAGNEKRSLAGHRQYRVDKDVGEHLLELIRVAVHPRFAVESQNHLNVPEERVLRYGLKRFTDRFIEAKRVFFLAAAARELVQLLRDIEYTAHVGGAWRYVGEQSTGFPGVGGILFGVVAIPVLFYEYVWALLGDSDPVNVIAAELTYDEILASRVAFGTAPALVATGDDLLDNDLLIRYDSGKNGGYFGARVKESGRLKRPQRRRAAGQTVDEYRAAFDAWKAEPSVPTIQVNSKSARAPRDPSSTGALLHEVGHRTDVVAYQRGLGPRYASGRNAPTLSAEAQEAIVEFRYALGVEDKGRAGRFDPVTEADRARFELQAGLPEHQRVQLTPLGQALYRPAGQLNLESTPGCEPFPTGFSVCLAFLDFFKANGGTAQFGNPISPFEFHENLIVQYFERARFEWRADRPEGQRVVLTDLGRYYFDQLGEDPSLLRPVSPLDATINPILSLKAYAFVAKPLTRPAGHQTVYVIVRSQTLQPVSDATGKITVHWPEGRTEEYFFTTNRSGLGTATFSFTNQSQGKLVTIEVVAVYQGLGSRTRTSFRIWL